MMNANSHFGTLRYPLFMHTILFKPGFHIVVSGLLPGGGGTSTSFVRGGVATGLEN